MRYCINPNCRNFHDPSSNDHCPHCEPGTLLLGRYQAIRPLGRGAFGQTFEVDDVRGVRKVLKVLLTDYEKAISLFQREAQVLRELNHPGIPGVEAEGYFKLRLPDRETALHCLVMEYIEGVNLRDWLSSRKGQPLTQEQAIAWLKQLAEILQQIHQQRYLHRDIKPSNIMLKPDGQLVLIDFGAVREATETYLKKLEQKDGTAIVTPGYTPLEQANGQAVLPQSDFYALGRTFVHLLTCKSPLNFPEDNRTGQLYWRHNAPQISQNLADLIDDLMSPFSGHRPENAEAIQQRLEAIVTPINSHHPQGLSFFHALIYPLRDNRLNEAPTRLPNSDSSKLVRSITATTVFLLVTGSIIVVQPWKQQKACDATVGDGLSCGEEILAESPVLAKKKGVEEFTRGNYAKAISFLEQARQEQPSDPETLIYLNNARLANQKAYTIAVAVPLSKVSSASIDVLRGVAQAQDEINRKKIRGLGLRVIIADDANSTARAKEVAEVLVSKRDILGVIGHCTSETMLASLPIYQQHGLVVVSPGSFSDELTHWGQRPDRVFFRTVSTTQIIAQSLTNYLLDQAHQQKAAIFYVPQSSYSKTLRNGFHQSFSDRGGKIVTEFATLSDPYFNASAALEKIREQGVTAIALFPDGRFSVNAWNNTLRLIKANQNRLWIVGGSPLYSSDTLQLLGKDVTNRLVANIEWHPLASPDPQFPQTARRLWQANLGWHTATAYDSTRVLIAALEKQPLLNRSRLQKVLADSNFQATGATGTISFNGGDRKENASTLVKVVRSDCSTESYTFVPINYAVAQSQDLPDCKP